MRLQKSKSFLRQEIAQRVSSISRYCDRLVQWLPHAWDTGEQLEHCDCPAKHRSDDLAEIESWTRDPDSRIAILLNGNFNHHYDIHQLLTDLKPSLGRGSRVIAICYNPYLQPVFRLANALGLRDGPPPTTFVTHSALSSIARTAGYEVVRARPVGHCPFRLLGLGVLVNRVLAGIPILRHLALVSVLALRPVKKSERRPSLSILIPARDERDNIEPALERLPDLGGAEIEVIFVEGHSTDGTWEEIERVVEAWKNRVVCRAFQQTGVGKADAVRLGLGKATKDLVTILDADLTMPPEHLSRYYDAYCDGLADFINGSRLVYPMEGQAMRPLNRLGNVFFAKALSLILEMSISDALCGTKMLSRRDCERFARWRSDFGEFDPFGDFELLFPAATMALGSVDVAVRYHDRTYGSTSIRRFTHGFELLKMTTIGLFRIKFGP